MTRAMLGLCVLILGCARPGPVNQVPTAPTNMHATMVIKARLVFDPTKPSFHLKSEDEFWEETVNDHDCDKELKKWAASPYVRVCS